MDQTPATAIGGALSTATLSDFIALRFAVLLVSFLVISAIGYRMRRDSHLRAWSTKTYSAVASLFVSLWALALMSLIFTDVIAPFVIPRVSPSLAPAVFDIPLVCLLIAGARVANKLVRVLVERGGLVSADPLLASPLVRLIQCVVAGLALMIALHLVGIHVEGLLLSASVAGVVIAFAARESLSNVVVFMMMLFDPLFRVGERITIYPSETLNVQFGASGTVQAVTMFHTRLRGDGGMILIPNRLFGGAVVKNHDT